MARLIERHGTIQFRNEEDTTSIPIEGASWSPLSIDQGSISATFDPDEEKVLVAVPGRGNAQIVGYGDGDSRLVMRVVVDGAVEDEFRADRRFLGACAFNTELKITAKNTTAEAITAPTSSVAIRGVRG